MFPQRAWSSTLTVFNLTRISDITSTDARLFIRLSLRKQNRAAPWLRGFEIRTNSNYRPKCEAFFV
jgi:hypothetical protein